MDDEIQTEDTAPETTVNDEMKDGLDYLLETVKRLTTPVPRGPFHWSDFELVDEHTPCGKCHDTAYLTPEIFFSVLASGRIVKCGECRWRENWTNEQTV